MSGVRYCTYCRCNKPTDGFVDVIDRRGRRVNRKCGDCIAKTKLPKAERDRRGKEHGALKRGASARRQQELRTLLRAQALRKRREEKS